MAGAYVDFYLMATIITWHEWMARCFPFFENFYDFSFFLERLVRINVQDSKGASN